MLMSKLLGERYKEMPTEATTPSHIYLLKGGYIRQITNGLYTLLPPAQKIVRKIEEIIRQEMDNIDGQEVLFPSVMPVSLWEESGRNAATDEIMLRFKDRKGMPLLIGISHEEAAVHLSRTEAKSYAQFPFMIYQFQTKFRDEVRSRGGLIRVREFTMKDGYSYHTSQEDMDNYYAKALKAYERIYERVGIPEVISVLSDNGIMGGDLSHEFMLLAESGEDTIVLCDKCDYRSNMELATSKQNYKDDFEVEPEEIKRHFTPDVTDIKSLAQHLNVKEEQTIKATVFSKKGDKNPIIVFTRGDREVNEAKLCSLLGVNIDPFVETEKTSLVLGYLGPVDLKVENATIIFDISLKDGKNLVAGGNEKDYHISGVSIDENIEAKEFFDVSKVIENESCLLCEGGKLHFDRGIEVGNIFQLGDKYTKAMGHLYVTEDGEKKHPIMGCYGIGIGRLLASVVEARHDDYGPIWPYSIAPWQIHICSLNQTKEGVKDISQGLYEKLSSKYEVLYDDRDNQPGAQFADADLLGIPIRLVVSPRNIKNNQIEVVTRDKSFKELVSIDDLEKTISEIVEKLV